MQNLAAGLLLAATASAKELSFDVWAAKHGKVYATAEEKLYRAQIFEANKMLINAHNNRAGVTYTMALNKFADLRNDEWAARYTGGKLTGTFGRSSLRGNKNAVAEVPHVEALPTSFDWVSKGVVNAVQNQGDCGSCWAFSVTACVESITAIHGGSNGKYGTLYKLSEQMVVDCDNADGNQGCNGGNQLPAFQWVAQEGGMCTEADYPYTGVDGTCNTGCKKVAASGIKGGAAVPANNDTALMNSMSVQPVSLSVDASSLGWQFYFGGVFSSSGCSCTNMDCLDHAVVGTGWGVDSSSNTPYYIVRNSWGSDWGNQGYIWLQRTIGDTSTGTCGVLQDNSIPYF